MTFNVGEFSKTIDIPIFNDTLHENDEAFTVVLTDLPPDVTLGTPSTTTVTIKDDDPLPKFSIRRPPNHGRELRHERFYVQRYAVSGEFLRHHAVDFFTDADSENDNDYQNISGTLTFAAGEAKDDRR